MANRWEVMSEYCREQHPLLCEEASEEEHISPRYYRQVRPCSRKGRARNNIKGAMAILSTWPVHWTSFLTYWWIGIGMISLTTFIIYNTLFAFSIIPSANTKPINPVILSKNDKTSSNSLILPEVFIHVLVGENEEINLNQYMPYVEAMSKTYVEYKFNIIVIVNDTETETLNASEFNEIALNMLWNKDKYLQNEKTDYKSHNVNVKHVTLSAFMDNSPLKTYWRRLPHQLMEFVARTVSIWDKGGIAFHPKIITPPFHNTMYLENLQELFNKYAHIDKVLTHLKNINKQNKVTRKHKKFNNIRDIIDALENNDVSANAYSQQRLFEAENREKLFIKHERKVPSVTDSTNTNVASANTVALNKIFPRLYDFSVSNTNQSEHNANTNSTESAYSTDMSSPHNSTKMSLLPLFLNFLFHNRVETKNRTRRNAIFTPNPLKRDTTDNTIITSEFVRDESYKPVILSATNKYDKSKLKARVGSHNKDSSEHFVSDTLTIDLKGNIIATDTACHAFLGTIYSNIVHYSKEESITDFIIAELSIFCNGVLSACIGIDLILL